MMLRLKDYAAYLLDRFEVEKESAEIIHDFHLYCKEFSAVDNLFISPKTSPKLLARILKIFCTTMTSFYH